MIVALWIAVLVLAAMTILLALVVSGLLQAMNELRLVDAGLAAFRPKGLPVGATAPTVTGSMADGTIFDSSVLTGRPHLVAFVSPDCAPCEPLLRDLSDETRMRDLPPTVLVTRPLPEDAKPRWAGLLDREGLIVLTEQDDQLADLFQTHTTPHVFLVDEAGTIRAQGVANSLAAIRELVGEEVVVS